MSGANGAAAAPLVVDRLSLAFGGIQVLHDIAVRLEPGEITGLIGPNGAGKTSFFNCLTGLYSPQRGTIRLGERQLEGLPPPQRAALGFSRSFQHVALCPELSIAENVTIGLDRQSSAGWLDAFLHSTGHGVGLDIHEEPRVSQTSTATLTSRCVVTVEPGVYLPDHGGVRIEDTVVVTPDGCRPVTLTSKHAAV